MRIGVNALFLIPGGVGGTEIYLRSLLASLADCGEKHDYFIFRNRETGPDLAPQRSNFHDHPQNVRAAFRPGRILWEQLVLPAECRKLQLDVLFNAGFTAPLTANCPMVTTFHDLQYKRHPEYFRWFDLPFWQVLLPASAKRSTALIAPSEDVRRDLEKFYSWARGKIHVIHHGVDENFRNIALLRNKASSAAPLLLTVSTLHPHKNLDQLLRAFAGFSRQHPEYRLVITGLKGFETGRIQRLRRLLDLEQAVSLPGWVPRADLYQLFLEARAFVYPSRFEGFGMPVLEALAAGIPTVCSRIPPLEEIAGTTARFFDPDDLDALSLALEEIAFDEQLRERLAVAGPARASRYSWERSARELLLVLEHAAQPAMRSKNSQDSRAATSQR